MLHVTCDLCGKEICPGVDRHYVVKIEAFAAHDPSELTEDDLDDDNLEAISELLRQMEEQPDECQITEPTRQFRYDFCPACHQKFLRDPLGRTHAEKLNFSKN
jgi:hypothetical protein